MVKLSKIWYNHTMRLNKYLAEKTGISRRQADELICHGRVSVVINNKSSVAKLGQQIEADAKVFIDSNEVNKHIEHKTIMINKPVGYLSSRRSQGGDPTIYDLLPAELKNLKTAGRLDKDSSGLMILSSDGNLIQQLTHPRFSKTKVYEVEIDKPLQPLHQQMISDFGVDLPDGKSQITLEKFTPKRFKASMNEGRNRQIRRTFAALGYTVVKLHRTNLGQYSLDGLESASWRKI